MTVIQRILAEDPARTRLAISRMVCDALGWCTPDGGRKEMSCRVALLRMQAAGLVRLPPRAAATGTRSATRLPDDWLTRYGYRPVLLE